MEGVLKVVILAICLAVAVAQLQEPEECTGGAVWTECGISQVSCWTNCSRRVTPSSCTFECYVGCICPNGTLLHEDKCIMPDECPELPPCHEKLATTEFTFGAFVPTCNEEGYYTPQQCDENTDDCWCSTSKGEEIPDTRTGPGEDRVTCSEVEELPPCSEKLENVQPMPGAFIPKCNKEGYYAPQQCHGSTGHCWCTTTKGEEIPDTRTGPGEERVNCEEKEGADENTLRKQEVLEDDDENASSVMTLSLQAVVALAVGLVAIL